MPNQPYSTLFKIVEILNDCKIHTGADMALGLGVSRNAVWKVIQRLKKYNVEIDAHHQGYQLNSALHLLDSKKLQTLLQNPKLSFEIFETIPSTNDYLKNKTSLDNLNFCLAEHQSKGRGRLARSWFSPFGRNIYCSFSYLFNKDICELSGLSLVIGILVIHALEFLYPDVNAVLKWPNDIYVDNKKMGGILIDLIAEAHGNCKAIIGIGLNVNMKSVILEEPWISLEQVVGRKLDRNVILAQITKSILEGIDIFLEKGMEPFLSQWARYDVLNGKVISLSSPGMMVSGVAKGINRLGYLLLELSSGEVKQFSYGDTTLLKS